VHGTALFVYGTLVDERRMRAVTGRCFGRRPAVLTGYERVAPPREFAYVVPRRGARVDGFLVDGLDAAALAALDAYEDEGRLYLRRVAVAVSGGRRVRCQVYVGRAARARG
jgi:gamma-glutamylcyclotransferase (GGCT)/AIG2-like uncharacterized protein YtfP